MNKNINVNNTGLGFFNILTIIFVIAKLTGLVKWSWWLCFAPTLIAMGLGLLIIILSLIIAIIAAILNS